MADDHTSDAPPCRDCPWLTANHTRKHPDGWFTKANRTRLWAKLRRGDSMSCHGTDPRNEVSDKARQAGYRPAPEGARVLECRGAVILVQREMDLLMNRHGGDPKAYKAARPCGLTMDGIRVLIHRVLFGGVPIVGGAPMGCPDLDAKVSHLGLPWPVPGEPVVRANVSVPPDPRR